MSLSRPITKRLIWPERASFFAIIGGGAGLFADVTSFFSEFIQPHYILIVFAVMAAITTLLCFQRAMLVDTNKADEVEKVVHCRVCDGMRFSLFAVAAFLALMMIGQGQSATEAFGEKLGLIHEDIRQINADIEAVSENVTIIGSNVVDMSAAMQAAKIIPNPNSAEEYFTNAWIYQNIQRNGPKALESLDKLYSGYNPQKIDAAELYYTVGRQILGKNDLIELMKNYGEKNSDATLFIIAGRNASSTEESDSLYDRARAIDDSQPFAHWDIMKFSSTAGQAGLSPAEQRTMLERQIAGIEKFIERINNNPAGHYFYLPQYQADHEMVARQTLGSLQSTMQNYERMDDMKSKLPKHIQEQMP